MKPLTTLTLGLLPLAALASVGCSSDDASGGSTGGSGGTASGGTAGSAASGGNAGSAASAGASSGGAGGSSGGAGTGGAGGGGLLQQGSLSHDGTFKVPAGLHSGGQADVGFEYGGTALGFNPANNSLFMVGHAWDQFAGEFSIPALGQRAMLLQPLVDPTNGKIQDINPGSSNAKSVGGLLPWGDRLVVSAYDYYDAGGTQTLSHFDRPIDLGDSAVQGPFRVGPLGAGFYSGYMCVVPEAWRQRLGGAALTGNAGIPIVSRTSYGPSAFSFDPTNLNAGAAQPLVYYPSDHTTLGPWDGANQLYGGSDSFVGVVFPEGSSSVLFFGRHGETFCYGLGTADQSLAGTTDANGVDYCYDPLDGSKGNHGYPYHTQVWAYDATELAAVRAGSKQAWEVTPYATWYLPELNDVKGAAYDPQTSKLYLSEPHGDGDNPVIHVYSVN